MGSHSLNQRRLHLMAVSFGLPTGVMWVKLLNMSRDIEEALDTWFRYVDPELCSQKMYGMGGVGPYVEHGKVVSKIPYADHGEVIVDKIIRKFIHIKGNVLLVAEPRIEFSRPWVGVLEREFEKICKKRRREMQLWDGVGEVGFNFKKKGHPCIYEAAAMIVNYGEGLEWPLSG